MHDTIPKVYTVPPQVSPRQLGAALGAERAMREMGAQLRYVVSANDVQHMDTGQVHGPASRQSCPACGDLAGIRCCEFGADR